ncbi:MAG: hypothetical protein R2932_59200 [Caldilineaceae bacterium]
MARQRPIRQTFLIPIVDKDQKQRTVIRNALYYFNGREILPNLFLVALTEAERQSLIRRFGRLRVRQQ